MKKAPGQVSGRFMRYQYNFAPAGMLSSSMMRFRRSSPSSWCTAEISIPQESMPIICRVGLLVCVFAIYYVLLQSLEGVEQQAALRQRLIFESRLMETQIAEQKKHSALMLEHMSELRRQRHDLRHQLAAIRGLAGKDDARLSAPGVITVGADTDSATAQELIAALPGAAGISVSSESEGRTRMVVTASEGDIYELSRSIFRAFAASGHVLSELDVKKANLEDIFLELTEGGEQA